MNGSADILKALARIERRLDAIESMIAADAGGTVGTRRAAEILGTTVAAVRMRVTRGQIGCVRSGGRLRFDPEALRRARDGRE